MKWFEWVASEKPHQENTDYCSYFFDTLFAFQLWRICRYHDWYNRGVKIPSRDRPASFLELQFVFFKGMVRQVHKDSLCFPHTILGYFITFLMWLVTTLTFPLWYRWNL